MNKEMGDKEITNTILRYIKRKDTDYAIMINGDWGCGKTYYVKNTLIPEIQKTKYQHITENNEVITFFSPHYISLYGISSSQDIRIRVYSEIIGNSKFSLAIKTGLNFISEKIGSDSSDISSFITACKIIDKKHIFIFDDLERTTKDIDVTSVLGEINSLTEQHGLKVIIISNDEKKSDVAYKEFREKTIRYTIGYSREIGDVYDHISTNFPEHYKNFLKLEKETILSYFKAAKNRNIRTLKFVLDTYEQIFSIVSRAKYHIPINQNLMMFHCVYSIEYKNGTSPSLLQNLEHIGELSSSFLASCLGNNKKTEDKDANPTPDEIYTESIKDRYNEICKDFKFNKDIERYIQEGILSEDAFDAIIEQSDSAHIDENSKEYILYKKANNWELIGNDNFNSFINELIHAVQTNNYDTYRIVRIYACLVQFHLLHLYNFKVTDNVTSIFKSAIDEAIKKQSYDPLMAAELPQWDRQDTSGKEMYDIIFYYAVDFNEKKRDDKHRRIADSLCIAVEQNDIAQMEKVISNPNNHYCFAHIDVDRLSNALLIGELNTIRRFDYHIGSLFPYDYAEPNELNKITELRNKINKAISSENIVRNLSFAFLTRLLNHLSKIK